MRPESLFQALGGLPGVQRLAQAWHRRVLADEIVAHAFSHGYHPAHTERLAAYWSEAWGGPPLYTAALGDESRVVRMHSGNGEHDEMDRRAVACFTQALDDAGVQDIALREALSRYFAWATHERMTAYPRSPRDVPPGLKIVRWGWHGPMPAPDGNAQAPTIQPSSGSTPAGQP
ncbi:group II truncated hemoglobin [Roseateles puraquae]|uniref:Oxidoreductase n=1 Tax=Roseateles puraquae TaxID=431059 RepID=A0A254N679_9BURK|nr:group II truncated hemoglobin [Roseateles puraquae]MDG0854051.1 oxidoreductase [Roseateles puraquae]OWR03515.1 oxidoreductase [Roseateles puraquae]